MTESNSNNISTKQLSRGVSSIVVSSAKGNYVDKRVVTKEYYNHFHFTDPEVFTSVIGITSPNAREGKTLVASNLATVFAFGHQRNTVLIDMNLHNPQLHEVFGTDPSPGLVESVQEGQIYLSRTKYDQLFLLPAGYAAGYALDLHDMNFIRGILVSLSREFDQIILDMNSVFPVRDFPLQFANELSTLLLVIDARRTKFDDVEKVFRHINQDRITGFIMNRVEENGY